jgi:hypothetical protein
MSTVNIYKDSPDTIWQNDETFLCVFDDENNLIAEYDFCTGLKLMQSETDMTLYINDDDLVSGKWIFIATKAVPIEGGGYSGEKIRVEGIKGGDTGYVEFNSEFPWNVGNSGPGKYVSRQEREDRVAVCKLCPLFDSKNITCTSDGKNVLKTTKHENEYCPEEKWGNKEKVLAERGLIVQSQEVDQQDQESFEADLEKYLEGL